MSANSVNGIHHVTALASDPQRNLNFYTRILGLRLVKKTVNFDAPDVYHFYFGDGAGHPGSILTFFPFPGVAAGKRGSGEVSAVSFDVPAQSLEFWAGHLARHGVDFRGPATRFGDTVIEFQDPDGMTVGYVFSDAANEYTAWDNGPVARDHAVRKLHGASMTVRETGPTEDFIVGTLGFRRLAQEEGRLRFASGEGASEGVVDLLVDSSGRSSRQSAGSVHHIAWRMPAGDDQEEWRKQVARGGLYVTEVKDRRYFHSIYFRDPGGILFEIATDPPGFAVDEDRASLGSALMLPPWLEPERQKLESALPPL